MPRMPREGDPSGPIRAAAPRPANTQAPQTPARAERPDPHPRTSERPAPSVSVIGNVE